MKNEIKKVMEFHKVFEIPYNTKPTYIPEELAYLRDKLLKEEYLEVSEELLHPHPYNMDRIAKELADLQYVLLGTIISYGLQDKFEEIFDAVHKANLSKLDACPEAINEEGTCGHRMCNIFHRKPLKRSDGKVIKSKMYKEADIRAILNTNQKVVVRPSDNVKFELFETVSTVDGERKINGFFTDDLGIHIEIWNGDYEPEYYNINEIDKIND